MDRGSRLSVFTLLVALAALPLGAQPYLPGWSSCQQLIDDCKGAPAEDIYAAALLPQAFGFGVGTCYAHDATTCPDCACSDYVKLSYKDGQKGWNGGTGCMASRALAAAKIKELCEAGACCCPQVTPKACTTSTPVRARDSITGSCCTFPNSCSVPSGWTTAIPPGACG